MLAYVVGNDTGEEVLSAATVEPYQANSSSLNNKWHKKNTHTVCIWGKALSPQQHFKDKKQLFMKCRSEQNNSMLWTTVATKNMGQTDCTWPAFWSNNFIFTFKNMPMYCLNGRIYLLSKHVTLCYIVFIICHCLCKQHEQLTAFW